MLRRASAAASQFEIMEPQIAIRMFCGLSSRRIMPCRPGDLNVAVPSFQDMRSQMPVLVRDTFDRDRRSLAATDAERCYATLEVLRLQRMQQRHDQPRAGCPDGM